MKKSLFLLVLTILLLGFLSFVNTSAQENRLENIQNGINQNVFTEEGKIDTTKLPSYQNSLEKFWAFMDKNANWLKFILGMKPEKSWAFLINILFLLTFINLFVITGNRVFVIVSEKYGWIFGLGLVLIIIETNLIINTIARPLSYLIKEWWISLIIIIAFLMANGFIPKLIGSVKDAKNADEAKTIILNQEVLKNMMYTSLGK